MRCIADILSRLTDIPQRFACYASPTRTEEAGRKATLRPHSILRSLDSGRPLPLLESYHSQLPLSTLRLLCWTHQCLLRGHDNYRSLDQGPRFSNAERACTAIDPRGGGLVGTFHRTLAQRFGLFDLPDCIRFHVARPGCGSLRQLCCKQIGAKFTRMLT